MSILCSMVGASFTAPLPETAVLFNGSNQYYNTSGLTTSATDGKYFTFASTFYWGTNNYNTGGTNLMHLVNVYLPGGNSFYIWINGGRMQVDGGCGTIYETAEDSLIGNAWNNVVFYFDSSSRANCRVYINGVSKSLDTGGNPNNTNINWGTTGAVVTIGAPNNNVQSAGAYFGGKIAQLYLHNASGEPDISKYWNSTSGLPLDLGTNGTATGLAQPLIYHYGTTSTFATNNGTGFNSYTLTNNNSISGAAGTTYGTYTPTWAYYTASTSETQANGIFDGQVAVMGYNSTGVIRAAYTGNNASSTQGFIKPILFNPSTNAITFGTKVNCQQYTNAVIYGLKTVSETEYSIGTADATNYGITYLPNNNSPGSLVSVYPFSMNSSGAVTVGTHATLSLSNVGTADAPTDIAYDGLYGGVPRYTLFSRYDTGSANQYAISRSSNTLTLTRSYNGTFSPGNRATASGSFAGLNDASSLFYNGNGGDLAATTFGSTTRQSTITASGLTGFANIVLIESGTVSKYLMHAVNGSAAASRIVTVTYSASAAPTISLGAIVTENATSRDQQSQVRLVKHYDAGKAYLFFIESSQLKVKTITVSGTTHSYSSATTIGSLSAYSFDIQTAYVSSTAKYFVGVAYETSGNALAFAITNPNT